MRVLSKEQISNFKRPDLFATAPVDKDKININIDQELKEALNNNDITKDQLRLLKKQYDGTGNEKDLVRLLEEFKIGRINYLMALNYDELDKAGLLEELKQKYLNGFQEKYFMKYGKHHSSFKENLSGKPAENNIQQEIERMAQFVIDNKDEKAEQVLRWKDWWKDEPEKLLNMLKRAAQARIDGLMEANWESLDKAGLLEELKQKYFDGYKAKYKDKYGIDYKG